MNWAGISIAIGLSLLAFVTMPYGILIIAGMIWLWLR